MLKYCARIEDNEEYYISNNYDLKSLQDISNDLEKAQQKIKELQQLIFEQYNKASQAVTYHRVIAERRKNEWGTDKKVKIHICVHAYKMIEGKEVKSSFIYGTSKEFSYQEKKEALSYVTECLNKFPGSTYQNNSTYKFMEVEK